MIAESPLFDDDDELPELPEDQLHRTDDPEVWGLLDVVTGRTTPFLRTIYRVSGDSASGVVGLLYPNGDFRSIAPSPLGVEVAAGELHSVQPLPYEKTIYYTVIWGGGAPPRMFIDEEGNERSEHSKGLLLGEYAMHAEQEEENSIDLGLAKAA
jgi:hypothetical protein